MGRSWHHIGMNLVSRSSAVVCLMLAAAGCGDGGGATADTQTTPQSGGSAGSAAVAMAGAAGDPSVGISGGGMGGSAGAADVMPMGGVGGGGEMPRLGPPHRFLMGVSGGERVTIVDETGAVEWNVDVTGETNDVALLPSGNVCFAFQTGAREVTPDEQVVWEYNVEAGGENHSCQPLDGGGFLIGESHAGGVAYFRELDSAGIVQTSIPIQSDAGLGLGVTREYDAQGNVLREFPCGQFVATRLPDGNTLIGCGDAHRVIEVDPDDNIVWEVGETEIPGNQLYFACGVQRLPNGNTVISNWSGHVDDHSQPQVFELTPDKQVVWEVNDPTLEMITSIQILDPGAPLDGVYLR